MCHLREGDSSSSSGQAVGTEGAFPRVWVGKLICHLEYDHHKCILGQCLFCLHSCCRWKDGIRLIEVEAIESSTLGLLRGKSLQSKTSLQQDLPVRFIPYLAIGSGISGTNWGLVWQGAIFFWKNWKVEFPADVGQRKGLLPQSLREFIAMTQLFPETKLSQFGTHSLKSTLLTYIGRCSLVQFSPAERRLMGHHVKPKDKSMLTYSHEAFTSLYVQSLCDVFGNQKRFFQPRWVDWKPNFWSSWLLWSEVDCSPSCDESSPLVSEDENVKPGPTRGIRSPFPDSALERCFVHKISGICHLQKTLSEFTFCGRKITQTYTALTSFSIEGDPECCINCGKAYKSSCEWKRWSDSVFGFKASQMNHDTFLFVFCPCDHVAMLPDSLKQSLYKCRPRS